jgi:hypothetical protein
VTQVHKPTRQSMALDELQNFAFECETIGRSVEPQSDRVSALFVHLAAERLTGSTRTQKKFDGPLNGLSIGLHVNCT